MIFKILVSRIVQTPNSDKNWQTSCPSQTFVCNIGPLSRHLEFIIEHGHRVNWVSGSLDSRAMGRWVTKCDPVPCLGYRCLLYRTQQVQFGSFVPIDACVTDVCHIVTGFIRCGTLINSFQCEYIGSISSVQCSMPRLSTGIAAAASDRC